MTNEKEFIRKISDVLEVDPGELTMESDFRKVTPNWSSLTGFGLMVMMEDEYSVKIEVDDFLKMKTIGDLFKLVER